MKFLWSSRSLNERSNDLNKNIKNYKQQQKPSFNLDAIKKKKPTNQLDSLILEFAV